MKVIAIILILAATGCHGQDRGGLTSTVFARDSDKDGTADYRIERVYRDGTQVMITWSKPDAQGTLKITSRSYYAGGELVTTEYDEDSDGMFETIAVHSAGTTDLEVFIRQQDGSVKPASQQTVDAHKQIDAAFTEFFGKLRSDDLEMDEITRMVVETQEKVRAAESKMRDGKE